MSTTTNTDTGGTTKVIAASSSSSTAIDIATEGRNIVPPRESLITTAVSFLQNAKVRHTTLTQKQQFLRSKGLTMEEVQLACERAGVFSEDPNAKPSTLGITGAQTRSTHVAQVALQPHTSTLVRLKEFLHSITLLSTAVYAFYVLYKKFIQPFLFGRKKGRIEESLETIEKNVETRIDVINRELTQMKDSLLHQTQNQTQQMNREFSQFRSDLDTIKGLLLNRKQFAPPISGVSAAIPAWQLASSPHHHHHHSQSDENEKADDAGSGSGSSETEVVTKNSDSSLEIM